MYIVKEHSGVRSRYATIRGLGEYLEKVDRIFRDYD